MPSSEECHAAAAHVREWYADWLKKGGMNDTMIKYLMTVIPYDEMKKLFVRETGTYVGPYSPYGF